MYKVHSFKVIRGDMFLERKFGKDNLTESARKKLGRFGLSALNRAKSVTRAVGDTLTVDITYAMSSSSEKDAASVVAIDPTPNEAQKEVSTKVVDATPVQLVDSEPDETRGEAFEDMDNRPRAERAIQDADDGIKSGIDWSAPYRERPTKAQRIRKHLPDFPQLSIRKSHYIGVPHRDRWDKRAENRPQVRLAQKIGVAVVAAIALPSAAAVLNGASIHDYDSQKDDAQPDVRQNHSLVYGVDATNDVDVRQDARTERQYEMPVSDAGNVSAWSTVEIQPGDSVWGLSEEKLVEAGNEEPTIQEVSNLVYYTIGHNDLNENGDISVGDTLVFPTNIGS